MQLGIGQSQSQRLEQQITPAQLQSLAVLQAGTMELQQRVTQELQINPVLMQLREPAMISESDFMPPTNDEHTRQQQEFDSDALEYRGELLRKRIEDDIGAPPQDDAWRNGNNAATNGEGGSSGEVRDGAHSTYDNDPEWQPSYRDTDAEERRQHFFDSYSRGMGMYAQLERQLEENYGDRPKFLALCNRICGEINERGYLEASEEELCAMTGATPAGVAQAIAAIQELDPPGIGARDLRECLLLQLRRERLVGSLQWDIVESHLEDLARNRLPQIAVAIDADMDDVREAVQRIRCLCVNPGWELEFEAAPTVIPDVVVERGADGRSWVVQCNQEAVPVLDYDPAYMQMYQDPKSTSDVRKFLGEKISSATQLMNAISQRLRTVERVGVAIVEMQPGFFREGKASALRPMTLADVGARLGLSEGTISRAVADKYMDTPWGKRSFKSFFSTGYRSGDGEEVSNHKIRELIKKMVDEENPAKPLSDQDISEQLEKLGYTVKRRTVAKYRDLDGIPSSSMRRRH